MINFMRYRAYYMIFSLVIFASFISLFTYKRLTHGQAFSYGVELTGGVEAYLKFENSVSDEEIKRIIEQEGWKNPEMRRFGPTEVLVRIKDIPSDIQTLGQHVTETLKKALPGNDVKLLAIEEVSGTIGKILREKSLYAICIALILMFAYIWFRFWSFSFGMGALVSLFHDAVVILLIFMIFDKEITMNVIGAILTVLGYSINDTIVVFARIRDNIKQMRGSSITQIVNTSINQTLRRTFLTSFATLLVVISLILLGGEVLRDLSLSLLVGIVFGTYSSIYIASTVMMFLYKENK